MQKKEDNTLLVFILLVILHFILSLAFGVEKTGVQSSPPREALAGIIVLIILAVVLYFSEKRYKYSLS